MIFKRRQGRTNLHPGRIRPGQGLIIRKKTLKQIQLISDYLAKSYKTPSNNIIGKPDEEYGTG